MIIQSVLGRVSHSNVIQQLDNVAMPNDMSPILDQRSFTLTSFLLGRTRAWGIFEDRFGRVKKRINVEMHGSWSGNSFLLEESFRYEDGRNEERTWTVTPDGPDRFRATCPDCIGEAFGTNGDGIIEMAYAFRLKLDRGDLNVRFSDRIIRIDDHRAVNRATMKKWGIKLGELSLFFEKDR